MKKLFLDDERVPKDAFYITGRPIYLDGDWSVVRSYNAFVEWITHNGLPELISFDHDLGDEHYKDCDLGLPIKYDEYEEKTGYHAVKWLCEKCSEDMLRLPVIYCHSMNPVGRKNIVEYVESARRKIDEMLDI